jgi:hypothetical protein
LDKATKAIYDNSVTIRHYAIKPATERVSAPAPPTKEVSDANSRPKRRKTTAKTRKNPVGRPRKKREGGGISKGD